MHESTTASAGSSMLEATRTFGHSLASRRFHERAVRFAKHADIPLLLIGESGSGKTQLARWIHGASPRTRMPFHAISLAALDDALSGSELFGHVGGAFTGARTGRQGAFASARGGTLFLDEIGKASIAVQSRLLTSIEDRMIRPIGADRSVETDVRLVFATNTPLEGLVDSGSFLADLVPRISRFVLRVPPLRERIEDVPALAQQMLTRHAPRFGYGTPPCIDETLMKALQSHVWPGNLRELDTVIQSILVEADGAQRLEVGHLQREDPMTVLPARGMRSPSAERIAQVCRTSPTREIAARQLGVSIATLYRRLRQLREP